MKKRNKIVINAIKILDQLIDNNAMAGGGIKVQHIYDSVDIPKNEFDSADTYLLQQNYVKGTMGGMDGSRWLTGAGVEFYEENISEVESVLSKYVGEKISQEIQNHTGFFCLSESIKNYLPVILIPELCLSDEIVYNYCPPNLVRTL